MTSSGDLSSESMGELAAHLDRAWDMLQKGDFAGAEKAAEAAVALDPELPEAHHVLGNVRAQNRDVDGAIESYEKALELEESFLEAMLSLAEVYLHPLKDYDRAEELAEEAYAWCESPEEETDVLLLKAETQLGRGDKDAAKKTLGRLPKLPKPENPQEEMMQASLRLAIGRQYFDLGEIDTAAPHIEAAVAHESAGAEAFYAAGLLADARKNRRQAGIFFLRSDALVRRHDAKVAPFFSSDAFEDKVRATLAKLEEKQRAMLENTVWIVADYPGIEMVADGIDPRIPIFAESEREVRQREENPGFNLTPDAASGSDPATVDFNGERLPKIARMFVYSRNIEKLAGDPSGIDDELFRSIGDELDHVLESQPTQS